MDTLRTGTMRRRWSRMSRHTRHSWERWLTLGVTAAIATLLYYLARDVDWPEVWAAVRAVPRLTIMMAIVAALGGYLAYSVMDILGCRYIGQRLSPVKVAGIAMISYALNLNLGMLIGGFGARLRLYLRMGCRKSVPTRIALFSALSNWIGFGWLAGMLFASGGVPLPPAIAWAQDGTRIAGVVMLALSGAYVLTCLRHPGHTWTVRGWHIVLPNAKMALAQSFSAMLSWALMGLVLYVILQARIPYPAVLGVLFFASTAALVVRVPGGLGTTEAITVAALSQYLSTVDILGAVLTYRVVYFLLPLALTLLAVGIIETTYSLRRRAYRSTSR